LPSGSSPGNMRRDRLSLITTEYTLAPRSSSVKGRPRGSRGVSSYNNEFQDSNIRNCLILCISLCMLYTYMYGIVLLAAG